MTSEGEATGTYVEGRDTGGSVSHEIHIQMKVTGRLTTRSPLLLLLPCSLRLSDQFLLVVGGAVDVGLGSLGLERSEVVPAIEDTREERGVPDNLDSIAPPRI
jgi:hypothetical protein